MLTHCAPKAIACHINQMPDTIAAYIATNPATSIAIAAMLACTALYLITARR